MQNRRWSRLVVPGAFLALILGALPFHSVPSRAVEGHDAPAAVSWEAAFEAICAKTPEVMAMSREELQAMVAECDRLRPQIEALPETPRKVYRKRLEMTRNLLLFTLEAKEKRPGEN